MPYKDRVKRHAKTRDWHQRLLVKLEADPDHPNHGTMAGYNARCRCDRCVHARRDYDKGRR